MTSEAPELLPCPFCEGGAYFERLGDRRQSTIVACENCGCRLENGEEWGHGSAWNARADLHQQAIEDAREEGYARAVDDATEVAQRHEYHEGLDQDGNPYVSEEVQSFGASVAYEIKQEIRALSYTPADPVVEADIGRAPSTAPRDGVE